VLGGVSCLLSLGTTASSPMLPSLRLNLGFLLHLPTSNGRRRSTFPEVLGYTFPVKDDVVFIFIPYRLAMTRRSKAFGSAFGALRLAGLFKDVMTVASSTSAFALSKSIANTMSSCHAHRSLARFQVMLLES